MEVFRKNTRAVQAFALAIAVTVAVPACSKKTADKPTESSTTTTAASSGGTDKTDTTQESSSDTTVEGATATTIAAGDGYAQWAKTAKATTSWGDDAEDGWSAEQATGAPNVTPDNGVDGCGDIATAWAALERDTVDTLTLGYETAVIPTGINIYETYNPGSIVKIEVSGSGGKSKVVYEAEPKTVDKCPRVLQVKVTGVDFAVDTVAVTVDQTKVVNWAEIDAVQLVGKKS